MKVLVLGGTSESRTLAERLHGDSRFDVVTSLAGRVRNPILPAGVTRVGGFGGVDGLRDWLLEHGVDAVVDATHPFAAAISAHAATATSDCGVALIGLHRPPWAPQPGDRWIDASSVADAAQVLPASAQRVLLTIGRQGVGAFAGIDRKRFVVRSIDPPTGPLPADHELLLARGPFELEDEIALMRAREIDVVVSKNSGGAMTEAKVEAARVLALPIVMIARPPTPAGTTVTNSVGEAVIRLTSLL